MYGSIGIEWYIYIYVYECNQEHIKLDFNCYESLGQAILVTYDFLFSYVLLSFKVLWKSKTKLNVENTKMIQREILCVNGGLLY